MPIFATRWKGAQQLTSGDHYKLLSEKETYSLVIDKVGEADQDKYRCKASNRAGEDSSECNITIFGRCCHLYIFER